MLSRQETTRLRSTLFRHLDGLATAPACFALHEKGVLDFLLQKKDVSLKELTAQFNANEGYLNVALRILCSQGWLVQYIDNTKDEIKYSLSPQSKTAFGLAPLFAEATGLLKISEKYHPRKFEVEPFRMMEKVFKNYKNNYGIVFSEDPAVRAIQEQVLMHIEGVVVGPTTVHLGMSGMFHNYFMHASFHPEEFHKDPESFTRLLDFFVYLNWFQKKGNTYTFTDTGLFFAKRASAYGVTVSYIPTFRKLDELIFGNPKILWEVGKGEAEKHVDREMNVWGSGGAHSGYFKIIDDIIIDLFNRPIGEQPQGILDMGCGNGTFLIHLFEVIERQTLRGKMLEEHPLFLVGADYNEAALKVTRTNLTKADIWAKVIWGDIGRPDLLASDLKGNYGIDLKNLLNVRTFLDHNRVWEEPKTKEITDSRSTGAFCFRGRRLDNNQVEESLKEHLQKWVPFVERFGLLMIELHTIPPALTAANLGNTAATAYDATHGFSDQYILEVDAFTKVAAQAGLYSNQKFFRKFPDSDLATVTINLFETKAHSG